MMNVARRGAFIDQLRQTKIENLHLTCRRDHHVTGFHIAMDDAALVRCGQRIGNLNGNRQRAAKIEGPSVD